MSNSTNVHIAKKSELKSRRCYGSVIHLHSIEVKELKEEEAGEFETGELN